MMSKTNGKVKFIRRHTFPKDIVRARSRLCRTFLEWQGEDGSKADYLLFVDADNVPKSEVIASMIAADLDILGCPYPRREDHPARRLGDPLSQVRYSYQGIPGAKLDKHACVEIKGIGFGFMLIKRAVIEDMIKRSTKKCSEEAWNALVACNMPDEFKKELAIHLNNVFIDDMPGENNTPTVALFSLYWTEDSKMLGEDYSFCALARDLGYKVHMFLGEGAPIDHVGVKKWAGAVKDLIDSLPPGDDTARVAQVLPPSEGSDDP